MDLTVILNKLTRSMLYHFSNEVFSSSLYYFFYTLLYFSLALFMLVISANLCFPLLSPLFTSPTLLLCSVYLSLALSLQSTLLLLKLFTRSSLIPCLLMSACLLYYLSSASLLLPTIFSTLLSVILAFFDVSHSFFMVHTGLLIYINIKITVRVLCACMYIVTIFY